MKNLKNIVLFTIISLLLFCGCSQENKSASDTVNPQDGKSVSEQQETIVDSEKAAENVTDKMSLLEAVGEEFPIVKDTTPNMMNPRLYTTSYNKPQGQQFDDTAVLSFIKLQYT